MPSKMTKEERAEYQREYRKRQRREQVMNTPMPAQAVRDLIDCQDEVARLKKLLAARPVSRPSIDDAQITAPPNALDAIVAGRFGAPTARVMGEDGPETVAHHTRFGAPRPAPKPASRKK